jgi:hypothetical protein
MEFVWERGNLLCEPFDTEIMSTRSSMAKPFTPTIVKLKIANAVSICFNKPERIECKVIKLHEEEGHTILLTSLYSLYMQLIKCFAASMASAGMILKEIINGIVLLPPLNRKIAKAAILGVS